MPLTEERMDRIQIEETRGRDRTPDRDEDERQFRAGIAKDIAMMKKAGVEIAFEKVQPDIGDW